MTHPHTDLIDRYLDHLTARRCTARTVQTYGENLAAAHAGLPYGLPMATIDELTDWLAAHPDWSPATTSLHVTILRSWARWAVKAGHLDWAAAVDLPSVRQHRRHVPPATTEQVATVLSRCDDEVWLASVLAAYAGLRAIEIVRLDREDISSELVLVRSGKGGHGRSVPCHPMVWRAVRDLPAGKLFAINERLLVSRAWRVYRQVGVATSLHKLRKWYASELRRSGVDLETIRQLLGHTSLATTQRYLDVDPGMQAAAVALLPSLTADAEAGAGPG